MRIMVYMKDGRTVYFLDRRAALSKLVQGDVSDEHSSVRCGRGIWNPFRGEYSWSAVFMQHISRGSIAAVEEVRSTSDAIKQAITMEDMVVERTLEAEAVLA